MTSLGSAERPGDLTVEWGGHDPGLTELDPTVVDWEGTRRVRIRLLEAVQSSRPLIVYGPLGVGKTFAVARAVEFYLNNVRADTQVAYLRLSSTDRGRGLYRSIISQLADAGELPSRATETELLFELAGLIKERPRIVVVDEVQRLSVRVMDAIQNLVDVPGTQATFVLIGNTEVPRKLAPELWSRAEAKVEVKRLSDDECIGVLAATHEVFAATEPDLLRRMNRTAAKGEFRYWVSILERAMRYRNVIGDAIQPEHVALLTEDL